MRTDLTYTSVPESAAHALQAALLRDFLSFARKAILGLDRTEIGDEPYLHYLAGELNRFAEEEIRRLIINLPPGHLKTMLGSVCMTAWLLAHQPKLKIIIVTNAETLSKTIARNIRTILQSGWFKELFATRVRRGHGEVSDFGTTDGGGVFVTSFSGRFTGRRADVIVVDDPHHIADSVEEIEKTIERFNTVVMSRLNNRKTGRVLIVAHRVHESDLSAHLRQKKGWKHVVLAMEATEDQTYETTSGKWFRRKGELLRPDAFDAEHIDEFRLNCFNPSFDLLYQQDIDSRALPAISGDHFPKYHRAAAEVRAGRAECGCRHDERSQKRLQRHPGVARDVRPLPLNRPIPRTMRLRNTAACPSSLSKALSASCHPDRACRQWRRVDLGSQHQAWPSDRTSRTRWSVKVGSPSRSRRDYPRKAHSPAG